MTDTRQLAKRVRRHCLTMTNTGTSSHIGSALSIVDLLAVLYGRVLRVDPANSKWSERDRFILSKGHAGAAVYATLAEVGFFSTEMLSTHYQNGSKLSGHVSHKGIPGVEISTGSLGHGLSIATGMAYAAKLDEKQNKAYCLMSDGECDEGSVWEAAMFASHHQLDNLVAIIDYNKLQSLGSIASTLGLEPLRSKWESFGWEVREADGHDHDLLVTALSGKQNGKPLCLLAHTVKGKGVSFMENQVLWHYRSPKGQEYEMAMAEVENTP